MAAAVGSQHRGDALPLSMPSGTAGPDRDPLSTTPAILQSSDRHECFCLRPESSRACALATEQV